LPAALTEGNATIHQIAVTTHARLVPWKMDNPQAAGYKHLMSSVDDAAPRTSGSPPDPLRTDGSLRTIDTHVHVWDAAALTYPWLASEPALRPRYGIADLGSEGNRLAGLVVVEAGCRPDLALAEVAWVKSQAARWPVIRGMVAQAPLERGPDGLADLAGYLVGDGRHVVGVRRNAQDEPPGFMVHERFVAGVNALAKFSLPFDACIREYQLRELTELADRAPAVVIVLDHLGKPDIRTHGAASRSRATHAWFADLADLAQRQNVVVKLSGLATEADHERWRERDIAPYLTHAIEVFGPDRCLFGSDWPVATLATTYERWRDLVEAVIADFPATARADILAGTAQRVYRLT
jgi:L-fuconolactonase